MKFGSPILFDPVSALVAGGLTLGGSMISASGARSAANADAAAGREAHQFTDDRTALAALYQLAQAYGGETALRMAPALFGQDMATRLLGTEATAPGGLNESDARRLAEARQELQSVQQSGRRWRHGRGWVYTDDANNQASALMAEIASLEQRGGGTSATPGLVNRSDLLQFGGSGLFGQMDQAAAGAAQSGAEDLARLDTTIAGLNTDAQGIIGQAEQNYQDEMGAVERDAGRLQRGLNRETVSQLTRAGVGGSSVVGNQVAANTLRVNEMTGDRRRQLEQSKNEFLTGLRGNALDRKQALSLARFGFGRDQANQNTSLQMGNLGNRFSFMQSGALNPWASRDASSNFRAGGAGVGSQILGNTAAGIGGQLLGYQMEDLLRGRGSGQQQSAGWGYRPDGSWGRVS